MYSTGSFLELLTTSVAWHIYERFWSLMVHTGLAYLPLVAVLLLCLLNARERAGLSGQTGVIALQLAEIRLYPIMLVLLLAVVPTIAISPRELIFTEQQCVLSKSDLKRQAATHYYGSSGTTYDEVRLDNTTAKVPLWWWLLNNLGQALSAVAINSLPCSIDLRRLAGDVAAQQIREPHLRSEYLRFQQECWAPAYRRYLNQREVPREVDNRSLENDVAWAGSGYFIQTKGFYNEIFPRRGVIAFPYQSERDRVFADPAFATDGGWPDCRTWWSDATVGLRVRLLQLIDRGLLGRWYHRFADTDDADNRLLYKLLRSDRQLRVPVLADNLGNPGLIGTLLEGSLNLLAGSGFVKGLPDTAVIYKMVRDSAPIVQSLTLMFLISVLPLLLMVSMYRLEVLMLLSFVFLSVILWGFLFKLVFWIDNTLMESLFADEWLGQVVATPFRIIFQTIVFSLYALLPMVFTAWMASAGRNLGAGFVELLSPGRPVVPPSSLPRANTADKGGGKR